METTEKILLRNLNLPDTIIESYRDAGVETLFRWQFECLTNEKIFKNGRNLIYSAPTSAGKSLIAEILILKTILENRLKALYILPFISLAREKMLNLQAIFRNAGAKVEGYIGTLNAVGGLNSWDLGVCTIEKANSLVNHLIENGDLSKIGIVVVDELHTVGDPQRGYLLELLLTKLKFYSKRNGSRLQIIGMSATLPNIDVVARWLDSELYTTNFRPVPLTEFIYCEKKFYTDRMQICRRLNDDLTLFGDSDNVVGLILETILQGQGVLIFCSTKSWCEQLTHTVSKMIDNMIRSAGPFQERLKKLADVNRMKEFYNDYKRSVRCVDPILIKTLPFSVAFHHAGLTMEEREHIERGFRLGYVKVIVATSTLSSGVNLPAKRVIIRSPWGCASKPGPFLSVSVYKQMVGRAGRLGSDTCGESILMCKPSELKRGQNLIQCPLDSVHSSLIQREKEKNQVFLRLTASLKRAILEIVVSGMATNVEDVVEYVRCTFAYAELSAEDATAADSSNILPAIESCVEYLLKNEFVQLKIDDQKTFAPTQLGSATLSSSLPPDEALAVFADLQNAQRNFVLDTDLHLLYLVTPYNSCRDINWVDWSLFYDNYTSFSRSFRRVADVVGVQESFLASAARRGTLNIEKTTKENEIRQIFIHKRFFAALALFEVINEKPIGHVAQIYGCDRGHLQSLQQQASTYAGMMAQFCDRLGWYHLKLLLSGFAERIAFGVRSELTELVQIDGVDGHRARAFHSAGFSTVSSLLQCDLNEIVNILRKAVPFQSANDKNKKHPWLAGHSDLTENEAAALILSRAKTIFDEKLKRLGVVVDEQPKKKNEIREKSSKNIFEKVENENFQAKNVENSNDSVEKKSVFVESNSKIEVPMKIFEENVEPTKRKSISFHLTDEILNDSWGFDFSSTTKKIDELHKNFFSSSPLMEKIDDVQVDFAKIDENFDVSSSKMENLIGNLSRVSISPSVRGRASRESLTESQILNFLNDDMSSPKPPSTPNLAFNGPTSPTCEKIDQSSTPTLFADEENESEMDRSQKILCEINSNLCSQDLFTPVYPLKRSRLTNEDSISTPILSKKRSKNKENRNDSVQNTSEIVDLCRDVETFENFRNSLKNSTIVSIALDGTKRENSDEFEKVDSVMFCIDENVSYLLNFVQNEFRVVSMPERVKMFRSIVEFSTRTIVVEDCKEFFRICIQFFKFRLSDAYVFCLRTAVWMLNQDFAHLNLNSLSKTFLPEPIQKRILNEMNARIYLLLYPNILNALKTKNLHKIYLSLEAKIVAPTLKMEMMGVIFDIEKCDALIVKLKNLMKTIETRCFSFAKRQFSINSHRDVAKILFVDLGLPAPNDPKTTKIAQHFSTTRETLKKLTKFHKLPSLIINWRRIHHALTCYIYPFRKRAIIDQNSAKIYGRYERFTATGRMIMREPSLQTFPKRFDVDVVDGLHSEIIDLRSLIIPSRGFLFLAADYSQMELRMLAHFSHDEKLIEILNSDDGDVFKLIAAAWTDVAIDLVTFDQRQHAKQICYGIIYGIGPKSLSVELDVTEDEASQFMDSFKAQYKGVSKFIAATVDSCRKNGFVSTIAGRRRYLDAIRCRTKAEKAQAERQAVNTTIQGSAADIFKMAFVRIEEEFRRVFADDGEDYGNVAKIVLQMHDELIVEVREDFLIKVAALMKQQMENVFDLNVRMPVKFKIGPNWGELSDFKL